MTSKKKVPAKPVKPAATRSKPVKPATVKPKAPPAEIAEPEHIPEPPIIAEPEPVAEPVIAPAPEPEPIPDSYYGKVLSEIPAKRYATDRLYRIGRGYQVTSGAPLDGEIEIDWPQ